MKIVPSAQAMCSRDGKKTRIWETPSKGYYCRKKGISIERLRICIFCSSLEFSFTVTLCAECMLWPSQPWPLALIWCHRRQSAIASVEAQVAFGGFLGGSMGIVLYQRCYGLRLICLITLLITAMLQLIWYRIQWYAISILKCEQNSEGQHEAVLLASRQTLVSTAIGSLPYRRQYHVLEMTMFEKDGESMSRTGQWRGDRESHGFGDWEGWWMSNIQDIVKCEDVSIRWLVTRSL